MTLINCKVGLSVNWIENCVLTTAPIGDDANATGADSATFKITDTKLYVPIVILLEEDNAKLSKLLGQGFKRSIYWNKYKYVRKLLDPNYQGVKILFVLAYDKTADNDQVSINSFKKYFLPRVKIENCNIKIDGRIF